MEEIKKHMEHECRYGNVLEVEITITGAGFEGSSYGGEETTYDYSFGNLHILIAQKE